MLLHVNYSTGCMSTGLLYKTHNEKKMNESFSLQCKVFMIFPVQHESNGIIKLCNSCNFLKMKTTLQLNTSTPCEKKIEKTNVVINKRINVSHRKRLKKKKTLHVIIFFSVSVYSLINLSIYLSTCC